MDDARRTAQGVRPLQSADPPSAELLLAHAMHALEHTAEERGALDAEVCRLRYQLDVAQQHIDAARAALIS